MSLGTPIRANSARPTPKESPLKRVNTAQTKPVPKLQSCWDILTTDPNLFKPVQRSTTNSGSTNSAPSPLQPGPFFLDYFCLAPSYQTVQTALDSLETEDLMGLYKNNITQFFTHAVKIFSQSKRGDSRRDNVVETLIPFLRDVLGRAYFNYSQDIMSLLAGGIDQSDAVFTDLVSSIDLTLQDVNESIQLRHRTLQLALVLVASANQAALTAYFLRRDLFSTLVKFMTDRETAPFAFESTVLLGILSNYRKHQARNPYGVRIEDFVEDNVMERIIDVVRTVSIQARDAYVDVTDDSPPSFVASLTSLVWSLRITELLSGFTMSLPPPSTTSSGTASAGTSSTLKGKEKEVDQQCASTATQAGGGKSHGSTVPHDHMNTSNSVGPKRLEGAFQMMPPEIIVILLPFYDLLNLNKAFCTLVFSEVEGGSPKLPEAIISFASYVLCHAATTARSRAYARLCLSVLFVLVEEGEGKLTSITEPVRLCRQRQPMMAYQTDSRPLIAAMLDSAVIFLRHNLRKRLDMETYVVCLRLVQRIMQQLKTERARIDYDWVTLWRSVLALANFVLARLDDLRQSATTANSNHLVVERLVSQIFVVLAYPVYWGEMFFPDARTAALLHYELLHAERTLVALSDRVLLPSTQSSTTRHVHHSSHNHSNNKTGSGPLFSPSSHLVESRRALTTHGQPHGFGYFASGGPQASLTSASFKSPNGTGLSSSSSSSVNMSGGASAGAGVQECVSNLRTALAHFKNALAAGRTRPTREGTVSSETRTGHDNISGQVVGAPTKGSEAEVNSLDVDVEEAWSGLDPDEILRVVEANLGGLELVESAAMLDMRRGDVANGVVGGAGVGGTGSGSGEGFFGELLEFVTQDVLRLIPN